MKAKYRVIHEVLQDGDLGVDQTIDQMNRLAQRDSKNEFVVSVTQKLSKIAKNDVELAQLICNYVKKNVKYKKDPNGEEHITAPKWLLSSHATGDCDCMATTVASLCLCANYFTDYKLKCAFKVIAWDKERGKEFTHIYSLIFCPSIKRYIPADTVPGTSFGEENSSIFRHKIYKVK